MVGTDEIGGRLPSKMVRGLRWVRYLVVTMKRFRFAERWHHAEHGTFPIKRLYRLLLRGVRSMGVLVVRFVRRVGYSRKIIDQAFSRGYIQIVSRPSKLFDSGRDRIVEVPSKASRDVYA